MLIGRFRLTPAGGDRPQGNRQICSWPPPTANPRWHVIFENMEHNFIFIPFFVLFFFVGLLLVWSVPAVVAIPELSRNSLMTCMRFIWPSKWRWCRLLPRRLSGIVANVPRCNDMQHIQNQRCMAIVTVVTCNEHKICKIAYGHRAPVASVRWLIFPSSMRKFCRRKMLRKYYTYYVLRCSVCYSSRKKIRPEYFPF